MRQPIKILHVGKYYPPHMGGIETHLQALCGNLGDDIEVQVLVANDDSHEARERIDGIPVTRVPTRLRLASAPICPTLGSYIRSSGADLVHIHLPNPTAILAYLTSGHRGPVVATYHSDTVKQKFLGFLFEPILHRFLNRARTIIATSPNYVQSSPVLDRHRSQCTVIPYGIAIEEFARRDSSAISRIREQFGPRIVIAVGRMVYYKGFEYLIRAMTRIEAHLLLVGDGPLAGRLKHLAGELGVTERVTFLGNIHNAAVVPYYHAADVFVLPSIARSEAFGIVQIEAMAAGKPVVNTELDSGVPYVSQHGLTGITVEPKNPVALAAAINLLLDDSDLRSKYGAAGRARVHAEFSLETMAARTRQAYSAVLSQRAGSMEDNVYADEKLQMEAK